MFSIESWVKLILSRWIVFDQIIETIVFHLIIDDIVQELI